MRGSITRRPFKAWRQAKRQIKAVLIARAKARDIISYKELVRQVTELQLEPQSRALRTMLREIAAAEHAAGRGMLTALVVVQPGPGFFDPAGHLGKSTNDVLHCWIKELKRVYNDWSRARGKEKPHRRQAKRA